MDRYSLKEKTILMTMTILAFVAAFLFFQRFQPETFMKKAGEPVEMGEIETGTSESYTGKTAGEDLFNGAEGAGSNRYADGEKEAGCRGKIGCGEAGSWE